MSGKIYCSAPGSLITPPSLLPFDEIRVRSLLETIFHVIYTELDAVVLSVFLDHFNAFLEEQSVIDSSNLSPKQVRQSIEGRLCPDHLIVKEVPSRASSVVSNDYSTNSWYSISPCFVTATLFRVVETRRLLRDELSRWMVAEEYNCSTCDKTFDSLRAISLEKNGLFFCDICDGELMASDNKLMKTTVEEKLKRFNSQIGDLEVKLTEATKMYIPKPLVIKQTSLVAFLEKRQSDEKDFNISLRDQSFLRNSSKQKNDNLILDKISVASEVPAWLDNRTEAETRIQQKSQSSTSINSPRERSTVTNVKTELNVTSLKQNLVQNDMSIVDDPLYYTYSIPKVSSFKFMRSFDDLKEEFISGRDTRWNSVSTMYNV